MYIYRTITKSLIVIAVALMASIGPSHAQELKTLTVALTWIPNVQFAGLWIAMDQGYFKEEGLKIKFIRGGPKTAPAAVSVAAGKAQIGYTHWLPFVDAVLRGNKFKLIAATYPQSPQGVISLAKKPILTAKDLLGSGILTPAPNAKIAVDATLRINGLNLNWKQIPAGFSPEPLIAGQGDGFIGFATNQVITMEKLGLKRNKDFYFTSFYDMGFPQFADGIFVQEAFLKSDRRVVVGFLRALARGWEKNMKNPAFAADLTIKNPAKDLGLNPAQQRRQNEIQIARMPKNPRDVLVLDRATISGPMYKAALATGRKALPEPSTIMDFDIMDEIQSGLAKK